MIKNLYIILILCLTSFSMVSNAKEKHSKTNVTNDFQETSLKKEGIKSIPQISVEEENNLLSEFKTYNIGKNTQEGTVTLKDSIIEIAASGTDIGGTKDEGIFVFKQIKGNFEISVRVLDLSLSNIYTKAGIMARSDLTDNSKNIFFLVYPDNEERINNNGGCEFTYRSKRGDETKSIYPNIQTAGDKFNVNYPDTWIKLKRDGDSFSSYLSKDSLNWYPYTTYRQKMPKSILVGLAVTSHDQYGYTKAKFSELQIKINK